MASLAPAEKAPTGKPLKVGSPHDPAEREADRVADILTAPEEPAMPVCTACAAGGAPCAACGGGDGGGVLRRQVAAGGDGGSGGEMVAPPSVHRVLSEPGEPLPAGIRGKFERRLGVDLGGVSIHQGSSAAEVSRSIGARALTVGDDIAFARGQFDPGQPSGMHLLAHELAHTMQEGGSPTALIHRALDPANQAAWSWFSRAYRRREFSQIYGDTIAASAGAALDLTEAISTEPIPADSSAREDWRDELMPQLETLVRLNALGLMASHKASIEGRRDELLHPPADTGGTGQPGPADQLRAAARVLNRLNSALDYQTWSRVHLHGVGAEARQGTCWTMSGCMDDWLGTMHENIQRYLSDDVREYWNERIQTLGTGGVSSDLLRPFFSIFSDTLTEWRGRQIAGTRMAIARVYDQFPLFKTLDASEVESDPDYAPDDALMRATASAYEELLNDVDEAIVEIGSGDIHPFNLLEAVHLTRESLPEAMRPEMDAVLRHHELVEFWTTMGLTLAQVLVVFLPVVGPALAFGMGAVMTAVDIESLLDRVELAEASTSPEGEILGATPPGAFDYLMAGLEVVLTAVDLGMMVSEMRAARPIAEEAEALARGGAADGEGAARGLGNDSDVPQGEVHTDEGASAAEAPGQPHETAKPVDPPPESAAAREQHVAESGRKESGELSEKQISEELQHIADNPLLMQGTSPNRTAKIGDHTWHETPNGSWCRHSPPPFVCSFPSPSTQEKLAASVPTTVSGPRKGKVTSANFRDVPGVNELLERAELAGIKLDEDAMVRFLNPDPERGVELLGRELHQRIGLETGQIPRTQIGAEDVKISGRSGVDGGGFDPHALSPIDRPKGAPPIESGVKGDIGEARHAEEVVSRPPRDASKQVSNATLNDWREELLRGRISLEDFARRFPDEGGAAQVFLPTAEGGGRYIDHMYVDGSGVVLRESKNVSIFRLIEDYRRQIAKDLNIIEKFPGARIEWRISGAVDAETLHKLELLRAENPGRFNFVLDPVPFSVP